MKIDGSERSLLLAFVPQGITAGCNQGRWQREIAASSVWMKVRKRDSRSGIDGRRGLIGIGGGMLRIGAGCRRGQYQIHLICGLGWKIEVSVAAIMGIALKGGGSRDGSNGSRNAALIPVDRP
ncbi:hypothetical protein B296_00041216 [Ensete ventricosum]|uniref:Uncharacterized protein n=1 Tax=Ensete ventricosum TaxID=4639 RepID=A0A426XYP8_ENSVE|nr:hypothetical protein B296_00041216 [Ensete ventricosum]